MNVSIHKHSVMWKKEVFSYISAGASFFRKRERRRETAALDGWRLTIPALCSLGQDQTMKGALALFIAPLLMAVVQAAEYNCASPDANVKKPHIDGGYPHFNLLNAALTSIALSPPNVHISSSSFLADVFNCRQVLHGWKDNAIRRQS